jgi:hypothetical protein
MIDKAKTEKAPAPEEEEAAAPAAPEPDGDEGASSPKEASDDDGDEGDEGGEDMPSVLEPEYKRFVTALYQVLYQNEQTSRNVLDTLDPSDQGKIESVAKTTMIVLHQLDSKLNLQGDVIPYAILTIVDRLIELLERAKQAKFSEQEIMLACSAAFDGAQEMIPNEQTQPEEGADVDTEATDGAEPGAVPPGAAAPAPEAAEAPEASPTEEEVA